MWPYLWMLLGAAATASMVAGSHALNDRCDWRYIALCRASLALLFAASLARGTGAAIIWRWPLSLWVRSLAGSLSMVLSFFAFARLPVADVLTLTNMFPIWVALLSWPVLRQKPKSFVWLAAVLGVTGVTCMQQPHFATSGSDSHWGAAAALWASISSAIAMLGLHQLKGIPAWSIVTHFSGVAVACCGTVVLTTGLDKFSQTVWDQQTLLLLLVGLCATLAQLCLTKAFSSGPPSQVAVVSLTQVVFGMLYDIGLWNREFDTPTLVGMTLVVAPTAWLLLSRPDRTPDS